MLVADRLTVKTAFLFPLFPSVIATSLMESEGLLGGCTVSEKVQPEVAPPEPVAMQVTLVVPTGKVEPDGGEQTTVGCEQLSVAEGVG